jgi:hypothetical protein
LSAASIPLVDLPPDEAKRLPRYPTMPAVRIGRLGRRPALPTPGSWRTDADERGSSGHSGRRGRIRPLVDSKNDQAAAFYQRYGFHPIVSKPETLFLPLAAALKTLFLKGAQ